MADALGDYLKNIGRVPLLTPEEEIELGRQVQASLDIVSQIDDNSYNKQQQRIIKRGKRAADKMVAANLRLVVSVAKRYQNEAMRLELLDIISLGNLGLSRAVEKYDPTRGYKFSTYAYWWIKQSIFRGIVDTSKLIRLPTHIAERLVKVRRLLRYQADGTKLTLKDAAEQAGIEYELIKHIQLIDNVGSLDYRQSSFDNEGRTLLETLDNGDDDPIERIEYVDNSNQIEHLMSLLNDRERMIVARRYGLEEGSGKMMTLSCIGEEIGVTRERVRQILNKAINRMRYSARVTP